MRRRCPPQGERGARTRTRRARTAQFDDLPAMLIAIATGCGDNEGEGTCTH
jgi:hypothetical protein